MSEKKREAEPLKRPVLDSADSGAHQNITRMAAMLEALANSGKAGLRLMDVIRITGLNKTVAHRGLAGLVTHGLATYDVNQTRYFLGDRVFAWASKAHERFVLAERVQPYLRLLADELGDTIYFSVRRADEAVCYARAEGSYPIKTLTLNIGDRRPLGVGSGPLAIVAYQHDKEIERLIQTHSAARAAFRFTDDMLREEIAKTREAGYACMEGHLINGMTGLAVPLRNPAGCVVAALSIAAIEVRLDSTRRAAVVRRLKEASLLMGSELGPVLAEI